jgi:hypothetical protein
VPVTVESIDLYDGALGKTLIIVVRESRILQQIYDEMRALSLGTRGLGELVSRREGADLQLMAAESQAVEILADSPLRLSWSQDIESWEHSMQLVDGLLLSESPGHQYLTEAGPGRVLVLLSYKESSVRRVKEH